MYPTIFRAPPIDKRERFLRDEGAPVSPLDRNEKGCGQKQPRPDGVP